MNINRIKVKRVPVMDCEAIRIAGIGKTQWYLAKGNKLAKADPAIVKAFGLNEVTYE